VEVFGLEARSNDLARGIVVVRCLRKLSAQQQRELWNILAVGGITEAVEVVETESAEIASADKPTERVGILSSKADGLDEPPRELMAAPWMPPNGDELIAQRQALEHACVKFEVVTAWFVKVETGIDSEAWVHDDDESQDDDTSEHELIDSDDTADAGANIQIDDEAKGSSVATTVHDDSTVPYQRAETEPNAGDSIRVLFRAADAPDEPPTLWSEASGDPLALDDMSEDNDDQDEIEVVESRWRSGLPPLEYAVSFPLEGYPDILENYDPSDFGIAIKLSGPVIAGEEAVINAMFALWLSAYQDERSETFEPFRRADVVHDRTHRSALLWVEHLHVPATASDQVHFLMWIVARLAEITPIMWSRFDSSDQAAKAKASSDDDRPFVLAGNPFADRLQRQGSEAALAWSVSQSLWTKRELAGMLIEVALTRDPNDSEGAALSESLLQRALLWDSASDARGYLAIVLIRQRRFDDAFAIALASDDTDVRLLTVIEAAQLDSTTLSNVRDGETTSPLQLLLNEATMASAIDESLSEVVAEVAKHAATLLQQILALLPERTSLIPHLYNAGFALERMPALEILRRVISLPPPPPGESEARAAFAMSWNNACIHAHALGDFETAVEIAEGGLAYADENPYMFHSAACAYAAQGKSDIALGLITRAIAANYDHIEKMETDPDLAPLFKDSRFASLFKDWRDHRADLN
jgi:tetratricopeptide (TPR) repeat protein